MIQNEVIPLGFIKFRYTADFVIAEVKVSFKLIRTLKWLIRKRKYKKIFVIKNLFGGRIRTTTDEEYYIQNSGVLSTELLQIMDHLLRFTLLRKSAANNWQISTSCFYFVE